MSFLSFAGNSVKSLIQKMRPVKPERIVFTSFNGHYSDNPKYISQELHKLDPAKEIVWLVKKQYSNLVPEYATAVDIDDIKTAAHYRSTARAIVDNVYGEKCTQRDSDSFSQRLKFRLNTFLRTKGNQQVFTTWHGTPLKCMGRDQVGSHIRDFSCPYTTMLLGNRYTLDIMQHLTFDKIKMELLGTPRNDLLFRAETAVLREALGLPRDKKLLLFAPTFRSDGGGIDQKNIARSGLDQLNTMRFDEMFESLSKHFGGEWALVCRFHYHVEAMVNWEDLERKYPGKIINGNAHDDMAEYLACADMLLTDASSSMFDFSLTKKPCFLFFPDLEYYQTKERGFYTPIEQLPFSVAVDFDGLLKNIAAFDQEHYAKQIDAMLSDFGFVDDADSSERVARYILAQL